MVYPGKILSSRTAFMFRTLRPSTSLQGPKTSLLSKKRYNVLKFYSGLFSATLRCGTKMSYLIKLPMATYLISPGPKQIAKAIPEI
uniref:Uncharacterized protein n=1 Tax=Meloidogyne incognita TaxID=6306 RepID=A0A914MB18_MELIC